MNEEKKFPELSGIEINYDSVDGLSVTDPNKKSFVANEGAIGAPDVFSESSGVSNGFNVSIHQSPYIAGIDPVINEGLATTFAKIQEDFERHLMFGPSKIKQVDSNWFDLTLNGKDLEYWEQLKSMPRFMILEIIVDPEMEYKFTKIMEKSKNRISRVLGKDLTYNQETILIERYKEAVSEQIFGSKDPSTIQEIIDAKKLESKFTKFRTPSVDNIADMVSIANPNIKF
jgi:hypothetical protein